MRIDRLLIASRRLAALPGSLTASDERALARLRDEFPSVWIRAGAGEPDDAAISIAGEDWCSAGHDPARLDAPLAAGSGGTAGIRLVAGDVPLGDLLPAAEEILTRCQRLVDRRNRHSDGAQFATVLRRHRALADPARPLERAGHEHALDAWQWTLRLEPDASFELQVAALFHGCRVTEAAAGAASSPRSLQHPGCLVAGALAQQALFEAGIDGLSRARVASIISAAEDAPQPDREAAILRDADALSFFSLASGGFLDFHGTEPARIEVRRALARLSPGGRARLARVRLRRDIEALVQDARAAAA